MLVVMVVAEAVVASDLLGQESDGLRFNLQNLATSTNINSAHEIRRQLAVRVSQIT